MLGVIRGKVSFEIGDGPVVIQESPGILRGALDGAEGGFAKRIVIGGAGAGKPLGHGPRSNRGMSLWLNSSYTRNIRGRADKKFSQASPIVLIALPA